MQPFHPENFDAYHERLMVAALTMLKPLIAKRLGMVKRNGKMPDPVSLLVAARLKQAVDARRYSNSLLNQAEPLALHKAVRKVFEDVLDATPSVFTAVSKELQRQRHKWDVMLQSPPPARPTPKQRKRVAKLPLRERRAADAVAKLRAWERKQKIAVTKIKALRKKVRRYQSLTKKGSSNDDAV